jgi:hypothetical protein
MSLAASPPPTNPPQSLAFPRRCSRGMESCRVGPHFRRRHRASLGNFSAAWTVPRSRSSS